MSRQKVIWVINSFLLIGFTFLVTLFAYNFITVSNQYKNAEINYRRQVENGIEKALAESTEEKLVADIDELVVKYPMEIIVKKEQEALYATVALEPQNIYLESLDPRVRAFEKQGYFLVGNDEVFVWYSVYRLSNEQYVRVFLSTQTFLVGLAFIILLIVVLLIQLLLFRPLRNLEKSIEKMDGNKFDEVVDGKDSLNKKMRLYANNMQQLMGRLSHQNTQLEKDLQTEREHLNSTLLISRGLIHDLKTPVHQSLLENQYELSKLEGNQPLQDALQRNIVQTDSLLREVNEILIVMRNMEQIEGDELEEFNLVDVLLTTIKHLQRFLRNKSLSVDIETEERVALVANRTSIKILFHNIFANAVQYAVEKSELVVRIDEMDNEILVVCENICSEIDIARIEQSTNLFAVLQQSNNENEYSSRNGLLLARDLTLMLGGEYELIIQGNKVCVTVKLPKGNKE